MLVRSAFGYLPMAFILAGVAIAGTGLLVAITDDISARRRREPRNRAVRQPAAVGRRRLQERARRRAPGIPLFGVFLGAIILAIGAFVLWLEMIIRDAAIYICVFFLPLTFVAMIWPATSRWARRLVELLVAIILAKFVIVAILTPRHRRDHQHQRRRRRRQHVRADDRRRGAARPRRLVAVRAAATDPDDGGRRRERRRPALVDVGAPPDRPASTAPPRYMRQAMDRQLAAVDVARLRDDRRNDVRARTRDRATAGGRRADDRPARRGEHGARPRARPGRASDSRSAERSTRAPRQPTHAAAASRLRRGRHGARRAVDAADASASPPPTTAATRAAA